MNNLFVLSEIYTNGYKTEILDCIAFVSILCGIFVIISKNPIVSVLFLIGLFLSISSYLLMLGINFIGLSYLLVYVGAVSILFLFILMLINIRISELSSDSSNSIPLAILVSFIFYYIVYGLLPSSAKNISSSFSLERIFNFSNSNNEILYVTSKLWDGNISENSDITSIGNVLYTNYFIWLIIASVILLLAMVGAIVITIKQKK